MKRVLTFLTIVLFAECDNSVEPTRTVINTVAAKPSVGFTVENNGCKAPCEVSFTSTAKNATSHLWEFGDGQTSTQAYPMHTYSAVGVYEVTLTATNASGSSSTSQKVKINLYQKVWDKSYGENLAGLLQTMIATQDGGFLLAANTTEFDGGDSRWPNSDIRLIKVGPDGLRQWEKYLRGSRDDGLQAVVATADGGYLLGGVSDSPASGDKSEESKGYFDYWIVKVNSQGAKQWDKTFGGSSDDLLSTIVSTPDGGYLLGGYSDSPASGDKSEGSKRYSDYWIVKITADGSKQWDKTLGGSHNDELMTMVVTPDGGFLLGGYSYSNTSGDKSENSKGYSDYWVIKIGADGSRQWDKTFGGSKDDLLSAIVSTPDGGYLLGGRSESLASGDKSDNTRGSYDYWIIKIGADGDRQWDKTFGGSNYEWLYSIAATSDGGFVLGGTSSSSSTGDKSENTTGGDDYWIIMLDAKGVMRWEKTYGRGEVDQLTSVIATPDGGFLLGGNSFSRISGDKSDTGKFWVIKLQ